jgi:uncharacterized integral membrane protein
VSEFRVPSISGGTRLDTTQEHIMSGPISTPEPKPLWQNPRFVGAVVGALVFIIFGVQNAGSVEVDFLFWGFDLGLIVLMILCAVVGAAVWELAKYLRRRKQD